MGSQRVGHNWTTKHKKRRGKYRRDRKQVFWSTNWKIKWKWKSLSRVQLFATPWTVESLELSRLEYWSGFPFPSPGDLPNPGTEPRSPALRADSLPAEPPESPRILEWVAYPFSRGSSRPRNWTGVFCIAGRFFTNWAIREAQEITTTWIHLIQLCSHF